MMEVTPSLIRRFLENKCSAEEARLVHQFLQQHPEVLEQWLPDAEWESWQADQPVDISRSNRWFDEITARRSGNRRSIVRLNWLRTAAAAAVASLLLLLYPSDKPAVRPTAARQEPAPAQQDPQKTFRNDRRQPVSYTLDDGSAVVLYAHSQIVCQQPFGSSSRNIHLQGKALFKVAKDPARPFTVTTSGFSTTALGTVFSITAYNNSRQSTIRLLEGKVVLKNLVKPGEPVYLKPGEACNFFSGSHSFQRILPVEKLPVPQPPVHTTTDSSITETRQEIHFSNTPLPAVIKKIVETYKVSIDAAAIDLTGRRFTGGFLKKQSVEDVLVTIGDLNNITIALDGDTYRLIKQ